MGGQLARPRLGPPRACAMAARKSVVALVFTLGLNLRSPAPFGDLICPLVLAIGLWPVARFEPKN